MKKFLDIEFQIKYLESECGIAIHNKEAVSKILSDTSYYTIINGYNTPFLFMKSPKKYMNGVSFMEIYSLYLFDDRLRTILFPYLLKVENTIKHQIVYNFFNKKNENNNYVYVKDDYLKITSYDQAHNNKLILDVIINLHKKISKNLNYSSAIQHYMTNYSYVPLWVLSEFLTFGDIKSLYFILELSIRHNVARNYKISEKNLRTILSILTLTRNCCAHKNRLYCFSNTYDLPKFDNPCHSKQNSFISKKIGNRNLFGVIICLSIMLSKKDFKALANAVDNEIKQLEKKLKSISIVNILDIMGFPSDWKELL